MVQALQPLFNASRRAAGRLLDTVLPPRCLSCGEAVDRQGSFCAACWRGLDFIGEPMCRCCGLPFPHGATARMTCAACLAKPPHFFSARAVWLHDGGARDTVLAFKYADRPQLAAALAAYLARAGADMLTDPDVLIAPVPLHRWRLFARRYNQAAELARALSRRTGRAVLLDTLVRTRSTRPQQGLTAIQRQDNLRRAFAVRAPEAVSGKAVVLVDDVLTTGGTADACAAALLKAGARRVDVLTLTRVAKTD